jgi:hypothetical protein
VSTFSAGLLFSKGEVAVKQHYNLSDAEWNKLIESGVAIKDLFHAIPEFDPRGTRLPITKVSLLLYLDNHGDFDTDSIHGKIGMAVFSSLESREKIEVMKYVQWLSDGD